MVRTFSLHCLCNCRECRRKCFTVMSTIGIAFFGIGATLGLNPALIVGAIVSGAVFGDKMSPLSESTNLTAAVVDADLFKHIKISCGQPFQHFGFLSLICHLGVSNQATSLDKIAEVTKFYMLIFNFWLVFIPILLMFICAWKNPCHPYYSFKYRYRFSNDIYSEPTYKSY